MKTLAILAHAVADQVADMSATCERFDLDEQPGAAERLAGILERARALAAELNDLCGCEPLPPSVLGMLPPADAEPEHAK